MPGIFTISLDFELHWGCLESKPVLDEKARNYFQNTRNTIPLMLNAFESGNIHVTWASVGMLFCESASEWNESRPLNIPNYADKNVSVYEWISANGFTEEICPFHFAPSLIRQIQQTPFQEIGTHTFSHYFCQESGQKAVDFKEDLLIASQKAKKFGIELKSLVFPRNQFRENYLNICAEAGITSVRSNPNVWYWSPVAKSGFFRKLCRTADAYLSFMNPKVVTIESIDFRNNPIHIPASRLYRPWKPSFPFLNKWKMKRIKQEMTFAAQHERYYHLWWHPHNFGNHPKECMQELYEIIEHFEKLHRQYQFQSMNMGELTTHIMKGNDN